MKHGPFVLLVPSLYQTAHTVSASPSHKMDSLRHNPCIVHKYASKDSPYCVFQAQIPQKTLSLPNIQLLSKRMFDHF